MPVDLFKCFKAFRDDPRKVSFAISCGKDSAVMLDLASKFLDLSKHSFFYLTSYQEVLPFKRRYLQGLEKRYGIDIKVHYDPVMKGMKQAKAFRKFMEQDGTQLIGIGYKIYDSLQRRAILKGSEESGLALNFPFFAPLRDWKNKQVLAYAKSHRLALSPEYSMGANSEFDEFCGMRAVVLRHMISEEDYQCAIRQDPRVEVDYERFKNDPECIALTKGADR